MFLFKGLYGIAERLFFNTLSRKILGCMVPLFLLLLVLSGYLLDLVAALRAGASPEHLALLERARWAALVTPALALVLGAAAFLMFHLSSNPPLRKLARIIEAVKEVIG